MPRFPVNPQGSSRVWASASSVRRPWGPRLDEHVIREFLTMEYPRLVAAVAMVAGSRAAAEDAVQEALARAWERSERGEDIVSLKAWVTTVAMNLARSWLRRLAVERRARPRLAPAVSEGWAGVERDLDLGRALAALPRRQREAGEDHPASGQAGAGRGAGRGRERRDEGGGSRCRDLRIGSASDWSVRWVQATRPEPSKALRGDGLAGRGCGGSRSWRSCWRCWLAPPVAGTP